MCTDGLPPCLAYDYGVAIGNDITGRVRDKIAIVGDDIATTGSTLIAGAEALRAQSREFLINKYSISVLQ